MKKYNVVHRTKTVTFRLSEVEYMLLMVKLSEQNKSISEFVREKISE